MKKRWMLSAVVAIMMLAAGCSTVRDPRIAVLGTTSEADFRGEVVRVLDGDTIAVVSAAGEQKVRMAGIDAPEKSQPFGMQAKSALESRVLGKEVWVIVRETDRYGRTVGDVYYGDGRWANIEMIACGMAWHYKEYSNDANMARMETIVRSKRLGLWSQEAPQTPWEYRKAGKSD